MAIEELQNLPQILRNVIQVCVGTHGMADLAVSGNRLLENLCI
jgi:hypothetical protein